MNIKVSIIVPIYNVEQYLDECLSSIERQTLDNIEVILVNDGSTDESDIIAEEYSRRNSNFTIVNRSNGGLSAARNTGLEYAHGEYVYFLDSDDFLKDDAIERLYTKAKEEDLDQVRFVAYTFEDGSRDYKWERDSCGGYKYIGDYPGVYNGIDFYHRIVKNNDYYPSCCMIFTRRSIIDNNDLRFWEVILHEDNVFNFQLTMLCSRVAVMNEPLYYRRIRGGSITQTQDWMKKNKAMSISAIEADKFIEAHPQIKSKAADWQINFFLGMMLYQWDFLTRQEQDSEESVSYFENVKKLTKKYGEGISFKLFYASYSVYRIYKHIKTVFLGK